MLCLSVSVSCIRYSKRCKFRPKMRQNAFGVQAPTPSFFFPSHPLPLRSRHPPIAAIGDLGSAQAPPAGPEVQFQYGSCLSSETKSSNISVMDWDIWSKFNRPMLIVFEIPKCQAWPKQKPEVNLRRYGPRLMKSIWCHNSVGDQPIWIKFGWPMQKHMPITVNWLKWKPDVEFQYGDRLSSKTRSSNISAVEWDMWSTFGMSIVLDLLKCYTWSNQKPEVDLRRCGRHFVKSMWRHVRPPSSNLHKIWQATA